MHRLSLFYACFLAIRPLSDASFSPGRDSRERANKKLTVCKNENIFAVVSTFLAALINSGLFVLSSEQALSHN